MKELPAAGASQAIELPLNSSFELRAQAAQSLWRTLSGRSPCPPLSDLPPQRRQRLALVLRALDGRNEGKTYRAIAEGLFGKKQIPERAWKTHDLRNRTIRLVALRFYETTRVVMPSQHSETSNKSTHRAPSVFESWR